MRFRLLVPLFLMLSTVSLAACSASPAAEAAPASANISISLTTNPSPPKAGNVELLFKVLNRNGQPLTDADLDVIADHIDMKGMTMHGKAVEQGNGVYTITANFSMSGNWKLSVQLKKDDLDEKLDIPLKVE